MLAMEQLSWPPKMSRTFCRASIRRRLPETSGVILSSYSRPGNVQSQRLGSFWEVRTKRLYMPTLVKFHPKPSPDNIWFQVRQGQDKLQKKCLGSTCQLMRAYGTQSWMKGTWPPILGEWIWMLLKSRLGSLLREISKEFTQQTSSSFDTDFDFGQTMSAQQTNKQRKPSCSSRWWIFVMLLAQFTCGWKSR